MNFFSSLISDPERMHFIGNGQAIPPGTEAARRMFHRFFFGVGNPGERGFFGWKPRN